MKNSIGNEKIVFMPRRQGGPPAGVGRRRVGLAAGLHVAGVGDDLLLVAPDHHPHVQEHRDAEQDAGGDGDAFGRT